MTEHSLAWFNDLPIDELRDHLRACNAADHFVAEVLAGRPYANVGEIADRAEAVALGLDWEQIGRALSAHPRIGARVGGDSTDAQSSRREQASMDDADAAVRAALLEGNHEYEDRFGHVYLIRASGRSPAEMLAELRRRLDNDEASERAEVTRQLAEITRLRVEKLVRES